MTYNEIYLRAAFLNDMRGLRLGKKALTETVLLRVHHNKGIREFEEMKRDLASDKSADEDTRHEVLSAKAGEECAGVDDRRFSAEAFEQIVEAASEAGEIESFLAQSGDGARGTLPADVWLERLAEVLVAID